MAATLVANRTMLLDAPDGRWWGTPAAQRAGIQGATDGPGSLGCTGDRRRQLCFGPGTPCGTHSLSSAACFLPNVLSTL